MLTLAGVSLSEQLSALRTLYIGFRKAKLKRTRDNANLRTETLRVMLMQFLDTAAVVCKSEHQEFKKGKERTWDSASLGVKTLREIMLKKATEKTWDRASIRRLYRTEKKTLEARP
jgi:hypothetical protein